MPTTPSAPGWTASCGTARSGSASCSSTTFPTQLPDRLLQQEQRDELVSYYENTAQCFMVGAVARAYRPGVKVDTLPVLVGPQGWNKSHAARALCPEPAWFGDDVSTALIDRDTKDSLVGKWIVELAEFPHIRREIEKVKAFFSRQTDRFRRAYAVLTRDWPRRCVFIATTNELEFIDTTGNRRFWPVQMRAPADVKAIERDRDQLWAEAVHWYSQRLQVVAAAVARGDRGGDPGGLPRDGHLGRQDRRVARRSRPKPRCAELLTGLPGLRPDAVRRHRGRARRLPAVPTRCGRPTASSGPAGSGTTAGGQRGEPSADWVPNS